MDWLAVLILALAVLVGLALIPLGLPGLWVMVGGILAYGWLTDFRSIGIATIAIVLAIAFFGEIIESCLGFRFAKRYGGSNRHCCSRDTQHCGHHRRCTCAAPRDHF